MQAISAEAIEISLARLDDEGAVEAAMMAFATDQVAYLQYLGTEGFELLTEDERAYLQYLALVLYGAVVETLGPGKIPALSGEQVEAWDERCWTWMEASANKPITTRLDAFFENVDQEELLAFAEDSLVDPSPDDADEQTQLFANAGSRELGLVALGALVGGLDEVA